VGKIGIVGNFIVTASLQFVATLPLFTLFHLPSEEEQSLARKRLSAGRPRKSTLEEPLLPVDKDQR
jgi:hypothetical protein